MGLKSSPIMRWLILFLAALAAFDVAPSNGARILAVFPFISKSHMIVLNALTKELSSRGHEMVVVSAFPQEKKRPNYTDIDIMPDLKEIMEETTGKNLFYAGKMPIYKQSFVMWGKGLGATEAVVKGSRFKQLLKDERGFDLVITEVFMNEAIYGLAYHFQAPLVLVCPFGGFHWHNYASGNPVPLSYYPNPLLEYTHKMTFTQRLSNFLFTKTWDLGHYFYYLPRQEALSKKVFGLDTPSVQELEASASVVLVNQHFTLNYPRPLMPNIIEVGGMHVSREVKPLAKEFKDFLDGAKEGAIYFSMGSNLKSELMGDDRIKAFVQAFAELPQKVLWKWQSDSVPGQSKNVKVAAWMPQQEILAHPNVKVFVTHGGLLSAQEAAFHGVTLVGIPVFGDQKLNMRKAQLGGFGIYIDFNNVTKESIQWALNEALHNPKITEASRLRSAQYRDQPESPLDRAIFWTEYALRHKGAKHLRSAAADLCWFQLNLWDVYFTLLAPVILSLLLCKKCCCGRKESAIADKKGDKADGSKKKKQ
ncbi:UDP-glycosyltransferase UGT5-like [Neocloeon triangulifer]|uniref:UDP-glycosyltransferase UGT5-like n=1 Tax=Neocloeon triangulifer TaxID=2078957 RepID=UPI00286EF39E|nr:UDP-glycosyltransferase UGT5-like [Neocloeon triangulifer]